MAKQTAANKIKVERGFFSRWFSYHAKALSSTSSEMIKEPLSTLLILLVLMVVLSLPLAFYHLLQWVGSSPVALTAAPTVSLYLEPQLAQKKTDQLLHQFKHDHRFTKVEYISSEQGLSSFSQAVDLSSLGLERYLSGAGKLLPGVVVLTPSADLTAFELGQLRDQFSARAEVMTVQWDQVWVERLNSILLFFHRFMLALMLLLSVLVVLVVQHVIKSALSKHKEQLMLLRLLGAQSAYIRRPFLYRGFFLGFIAACGAVVINLFIFNYLNVPLSSLLQTYQPGFEQPGIGFEALVFMAASVILSTFAAWFAFLPAMYLKEN